MKILEEYFNRHNIIQVPVVHHCELESVFLRNVETNELKIFHIKWQNHDFHPGNYKIEISTPNKGVIRTILYWDEYEDYILKWIDEEVYWNPIKKIKENLILTGFEFLINSNKNNQAITLAPFRLKNIINEALNSKNEIDHRLSRCSKFIQFICEYHPDMFRYWRNEIFKHIDNYSDWLPDLISKQKRSKLIKDLMFQI